MSDLCIIKGSSKGIQLYLDPDCDFMDLITEICTKFLANKNTFGDVEIVLELLGRELSPIEVRAVVESIELNSNVRVLMLREGDRVKEAKTKQIFDKFYYEKAMENAKIIKGNLEDGTTITCDYSVLILGDVKENASVVSKGNVIVMGDIYGQVSAGVAKDEKAYIVAASFETDNISVAGYTDPQFPEDQGGFLKKFAKKEDFECAAVYRGALVVEPLSKGLLSLA